VCAKVSGMRVFVTEKQPDQQAATTTRWRGESAKECPTEPQPSPHFLFFSKRQSRDKKSQRCLIHLHIPQPQHTSFTMGNPSAKRKRPEGMGFRKPKKLVKKFKKQKAYHSDSEDDDQVEGTVTTTTTTTTTTDFKPVNMEDSDDEEIEDAPAATTAPVAAPEPVIEKKVIEKVIEKKIIPKPAAAAKPESTPTAVQPKLKSALKQSKKADPPSGTEDEDEDEEEEEDDDDIEDLDALDDEDLDDSDLDDDELDLSDDGEGGPKKTRKRNDPTAFATSMSKILGTKLTTAKRQDPVLSRSAAATAASKELADQKLEMKAKRKMHAEKREALDKGRVKDVLGLNTPEVSTAEIQETERRLQKTAQRGVVKLFNAVRAAQVQGETARSEAKKEGVIGISQRDERVSEMSKKGFLDLIATGGKKPAAVEA
jgi:fusion and transport protein UGO1